MKAAAAQRAGAVASQSRNLREHPDVVYEVVTTLCGFAVVFHAEHVGVVFLCHHEVKVELLPAVFGVGCWSLQGFCSVAAVSSADLAGAERIDLFLDAFINADHFQNHTAWNIVGQTGHPSCTHQLASLTHIAFKRNLGQGSWKVGCIDKEEAGFKVVVNHVQGVFCHRKGSP